MLHVLVLVLPNKELVDDIFVPHMSPDELVLARFCDDPTSVDDEDPSPLLDGVLPRVGVGICWV